MRRAAAPLERFRDGVGARARPQARFTAEHAEHGEKAKYAGHTEYIVPAEYVTHAEKAAKAAYAAHTRHREKAIMALRAKRIAYPSSACSALSAVNLAVSPTMASLDRLVS
jgi:hypothetical protein